MKNVVISFFISLLVICLDFREIYSSPAEPDTISFVYEGIPENRIFDRWLAVGPIPENRDDQKLLEKEFDSDPILDQNYTDIHTHIGIGDSTYTWRFIQAKKGIIENGIVDLSELLANTDFASAYFYARIKMPRESELILGVGSDDAVKVWINDELVHRNWTARGLNLDNDLVPVKLRKGNNDIVIKIQNRGSSWGFVCRAIMPAQYAQYLNLNAQFGNTENIKQLLKCSVDINSLSDWGLTPLQTARLYGQDAMAKFLLEHGADSTIIMPPKEKMMDTYFTHITKEIYPGAAVLISKDGRIIYAKTYGYANLEYEVPFKTDTKFRIASVTKQFTAAAILKLQEQGRLNINDKVSNYLPELPRGNEVTIHHLLTHTSGLQRDWNEGLYTAVPAVFETEKVLAEIKNSKYQFNPGETWSYSNLGYAVLTIIIERLSGLTYIDFLRKNFFDPLDMMNTSVLKWDELFGCEMIKNEACGYYSKNGKVYRSLNLDRGMGAGFLYSTLFDLFTWNEALFNCQILNQSSLDAAFSPAQTKDGSPDKFGVQYGCGLFIERLNGLQRIYHGGAIDGYECSLTRLTDQNINIIVLLNRFPFPPGINAGIITRDIERIYLGKLEIRN